jgi:predicted glycoside hydrolase/deacetylase ChbG (UPF0249 family)
VDSADSSKRIVTRGDDAGSFSSANHALVEAFERGLVRNVSVMVPAPHFAEAAELFRTRPGVVLGLHVTLNAEWNTPKWGPVLRPASVPSLVDDHGHFWPSPADSFQRGVDLDEAMREVSAQLEKARRHGLSIRYIDEHMGVGWVHPPGKDGERLEARLKKLAEDEGLVWHGKVPALPSADALGLTRREAESEEQALLARIDRAPAGTYVIYWHPAHESDETRVASFAGSAPGVIAKERAADFALATSAELERALAARGVRCIGYDEA